MAATAPLPPPTPPPERAAPPRAEGPDREDQLKFKASEGAHWLRGEAARLVESYNGQSRWWRYRFWIIASYAAVALVSVLVWAPPLNTLKAEVKLSRDFNERAKIVILNLSGEAWTNVTVDVRGPASKRTAFEKSTVAANDDWSLPALEFDPHVIKVRAEEGSLTLKLK